LAPGCVRRSICGDKRGDPGHLGRWQSWWLAVDAGNDVAKSLAKDFRARETLR
jgi:hypothetical protein